MTMRVRVEAICPYCNEFDTQGLSISEAAPHEATVLRTCKWCGKTYAIAATAHIEHKTLALVERGVDTASTEQADSLPFDDPPVADAGAEPAHSTEPWYDEALFGDQGYIHIQGVVDQDSDLFDAVFDLIEQLDFLEKSQDFRDELEQKRRPF